MRITALGIVLFLLPVYPSLSEEIIAKSKVSAVTVFPQGAEVTRTTKLSLVKGSHTIILRDLPPSVMSNSVRISGESGGPLEVVSVDERRVFANTDSTSLFSQKRRNIEKDIQNLRDRIAALNASIKTAELQNKYLESLASRPTESSNNNIPTQNRTQQWGELLEFIASRSSVLNKQVLDIEVRKRTLNKNIAELQKKLKNLPVESEKETEIKVHLMAATPLQGTLWIKYQVRQAGWQPLYDARLSTGGENIKPALEITRLARIHQSSGENWDNVKLSLSTTRPQSISHAPELYPERIVVLKPQSSPKVASMPDGPRPGFEQDVNQSRRQSMSKRSGETLNQAPMLAIASRPVLAIRTSFQAIFEAPGPVSINSSGIKKKVSLDQLKLEPELRVNSVPKVDKTAYLHAEFKLAGNTPLLPGNVALYRDGIFVGNGEIPELHPGVKHELGFGSEDAIEIKRTELIRSKGEAGLINTSKTDERNFKITVQNRHEHAIPVTIFDQVPFSGNEQIEVQRLSKTTRPTRENVQDRQGVWAWDFDLKGGEKREILLSYKIIWPKELKIDIQR